VTHSVLVLGGSGQLGSAVARFLAGQTGFKVRATFRNSALAPLLNRLEPRVSWVHFDALSPDADRRLHELAEGHAWIVNAAGVITQRIRDRDPDSIARAMRVDTQLPQALHQVAPKTGSRVLQIATDCVFSGSSGGYTETSDRDAEDAYGRTKGLGEVVSPSIHHLRCSIVGLELGPPVSLLGWFLTTPQGARIRGYTNHHWNGVTVLQFARIAAGVISNDLALDHMQHVVPLDAVTKYDLLRIFADRFGRSDVAIDPFATETLVDRRLSTAFPGRNEEMWRLAGYLGPPKVADMVTEFSASPLFRSLVTRPAAESK
jgi:dTDP-4-dehydrorhamnose reductase